jgi:phosphonoacetaldehyde hydrolase
MNRAYAVIADPPTYRGPIRAVVFDWAGTTQDHGVFAPTSVFVDVFARRGIEVTEAEAREPMGLYKLDHIRAITAMPAVAERWLAANGGPVTEDDVLAMFADFGPLQEAAIARHAQLVDGTLDVVAELRRRDIRIGSTTGYMRAAAAIAIEEAARQGYLPDAIACADEVPAGRPAPWMLLRVIEQLGVYPPAAVVKVGDTRVDIDEGRNAGAWSVGVTASGNYVARTAEALAALDATTRAAEVQRAEAILRTQGAHAVIDTVADLIPVIDAIEARLAEGARP